jgi:biotin synthase
MTKHPPRTPSRRQIALIGRHVLVSGRAERSEAEALAATDGSLLEDLFYWANRIRCERHGTGIHLCTIIAARFGGCGEDCKFCAQSARWASAGEIRQADADQIGAAAIEAEGWGSECFGIVTSGRDVPEGRLEDIEQAVRAISERRKMKVCGSLGLLTKDRAVRLAQAGLQRYNHNLETSRRFFPQIVTTHGYDDRVKTLRAARQAGLELCAGGIFGLGEDWADRLDLAFDLRAFEPEVVPLNFLHPIRGTPLAERSPLDPMEILRIVAVYRFIFPEAVIKVAGGRERNLRDLQSWIFRAGASGILIGNYLATTGRPPAEDLQMLKDLGLAVACARGGSANCEFRPGLMGRRLSRRPAGQIMSSAT